MKHFVSLAFVTLLALPVAAQQAYPLGHHVHQFQRKAEDGKVTSQGWDPTYAPQYQADKARMVKGIPTFPVGLPGSLEPKDLGNTGCPVDSDIRNSDDVKGLPTVKLSGVSGPVYLIHDCNRENSTLRVQNGMKVAVWGSAFKKLEGVSGSTGEIFLVDSLIDADPDDNAGVSCLGKTPCRLMYSEVLGGDDIMKMNPGDVCYKSHLHGYDRDSTKGDASGSGEHSDGIQLNQGEDYTVINCNIEGPFRTSNAPLWAGTAGKIYNWRVAESLASGGTNVYKMGKKDTDWSNAVFLNSQVLADAQGTSWGVDSYGNNDPCYLGGGSHAFTGEGITATNGKTSGVDNLGRSWNLSDCNRGPVSAANKAFFESAKQQYETWVAEIRAAAGADVPVAATINVSAAPRPAYSAVPITVSATVRGCSPSLYEFECGDDNAFDDGTAAVGSLVCGNMAPGSYQPRVRASGGSCESPLVGSTVLSVQAPPAPVLY